MTTPVAPLTAEEIAQQRGRHYEIGEDLHDRLLDIAADHARLHAVMNENPARGDMIGEIGPTAAALIISACQAERDEAKREVERLREERKALRQQLHDMDANVELEATGRAPPYPHPR